MKKKIDASSWVRREAYIPGAIKKIEFEVRLCGRAKQKKKKTNEIWMLLNLLFILINYVSRGFDGRKTEKGAAVARCCRCLLSAMFDLCKFVNLALIAVCRLLPECLMDVRKLSNGENFRAPIKRFFFIRSRNAIFSRGEGKTGVVKIIRIDSGKWLLARC